MCGIAGILSNNDSQAVNEALLRQMLSALRHRGPDESGIYIDPFVGLGNVRLSIVGLQSGTQPLSNEDGSLWIVYNGEVFNHIELREELVSRGHIFSSDTDTEVVLHLYEDEGPACLKRINGQFALAIWDCRKRELFLARDRVGIRPLHYLWINRRFLFASEIKALFQDSEVCREIDHQALMQVFTLWTTIPGRTVFRNVAELPPGHFMTVKDGKTRITAFWQIPHYRPEERYQGSFGEAIDELRWLLTDAVKLRLRADVRVGAYLSGGLDSSITTSLVLRQCNDRVKTFSIGFSDRDFDETSYQEQMVSHLKTDHHRITVDDAAIRKSFPEVVWHCEKPVLRTAPGPLFLLSELARENNLKVVLTGEGADEVFAGYDIFKEAKVRHFWSVYPDSQIRPLLLQRLHPYVFKNPSRGKAFLYGFYAVSAKDRKDPYFSHRIRWNNTAKTLTFLDDSIRNDASVSDPTEELSPLLPAGFADRDVLSRAQYLEMVLFLSNYILSSQGDRVAMAHSLEIRLPFLDYRVIDFAFRIPPSWKIKGLNEKHILKRAFREEVPDAILRRTKQPYRAPIRHVFVGGRGCQPDYVDDLLSEHGLKRTGLFDEKKVSRLVARYRNNGGVGSEVQDMAIVGILSTQMLHHQFNQGFPWKPTSPITLDKVVRNY